VQIEIAQGTPAGIARTFGRELLREAGLSSHRVLEPGFVSEKEIADQLLRRTFKLLPDYGRL
jgi:hypothetical protein